MSSLERSLSGTPLVLDLVDERARAESHELHETRGKTARTLVKDDSLRVTLVALGPGGSMEQHAAPGPITVQPLSGRIQFRVDDHVHDLATGDFLALEQAVPHSVSSENGGVFLLTVVQAVEREG